MSDVLRVESLNLTLDGTEILKNISCQIPTGKISVIIGPSGAGKSSLLKSITKLLPASGVVYFNGVSTDELQVEEFRKQVVYVSQVPVVFEGSVADNINFGRRLWNIPDLDPEKQLELVGLDPSLAKRDALDLSIGQQQRLHLARSLAVEPAVLLLDEPASGLDAISKEVFEELIVKLLEVKEELTVVMITHDLQQAKRVGEYAILLDKGRVKLEDEADQFFQKVQKSSDAEVLEELLNREDKS